MTVLLDASAIVPIFVVDPFSARMGAFLRGGAPTLLMSDFAAAEFASALGVRVRIGDLTKAEARAAFANFDTWTERECTQVSMLAVDVRDTEAILRRLDLVLRAPDALHICIAKRLRAELATFDARMAASARKLGVPVVPI